ncbi:hypothetical protein Tco_1342725, partial [Tanacetum coccineum]
MAWVCCCCGALGPIDKLNQLCNTSVTLFQVPILGHLSPSRFSLLMELLKILSGTIESDTKLVEDYQVEHAPWSSPDLAIRVQILVWRGIGYSVASWQPSYLVLSGSYLICWNLKHPRTISGALAMKYLQTMLEVLLPVLLCVFEAWASRSFRNSDEYHYDPEKCEHVGPKFTTSHGGNTATRMIWRFIVANDLKECSKIT